MNVIILFHHAMCEMVSNKPASDVILRFFSSFDASTPNKKSY